MNLVILILIVIVNCRGDLLTKPKLRQFANRLEIDVRIENSDEILKLRKNNLFHIKDNYKNECSYYIGEVDQIPESQVAIDICGLKQEISGFIQINKTLYSIQPKADGHQILKLSNQNVNVKDDIETKGIRFKRHVDSDNLDGYMVDGTWGEVYSDKTVKQNSNLTNKTKRGEIVCRGLYCEYYKVKRDEPKWLELLLAVDDSVVNFHGNDTVQRYVLTLVNIVSAIYADPTLAAKLQFVVTKVLSIVYQLCYK